MSSDASSIEEDESSSISKPSMVERVAANENKKDRKSVV